MALYATETSVTGGADVDVALPFPTPERIAPLIDRARRNVFELSGISGQQRGTREPGKTATETSVIQTNVEARNAETVDRVKDWIEAIASKLLSLMKQFFDRERIIPITGRANVEWVKFSKKNIQGEYDLDVELAPFNPESTEIKIKQLTDIIGLLSRMPVIPDGSGGMRGVNLARLVEELLRAMSITIPINEILPPSPGVGVGGVPEDPSQQLQGQSGQGTPTPLPGEGAGADGRSPFASQGAGAAMVQAANEGGVPRTGRELAGAATPSRGF